MANSIFEDISTLRGDVQSQIDAITGGGGGPVDASVVTYTPSTPGNWVSPPAHVNAGLDELAANKVETSSARLNPAPTTAGKIPVDTGSAYNSIPAGTTNEVLVGGPSPSFGNVPVAAIPTGIPATSLGTGTVDNTEFGYLDGVTSSIQTQLNGKQGTLSLPLSEVNGGLGTDVSLIGTGIVARTAANIPTTRTITGSTGISITDGSGVSGNPTIGIDSTVATLTGSQILTNKTISGSSNTISNIPNSSLTNSSLTYSAGTGLTGGGTTSLGGSATAFAVTYGTTAGTAAQGNDTRLSPSPSGAGKLIYDTGSAYAASAAPTSGQIPVFNGTIVTWATHGGAVISFYLNTGQTFVANGYVGIGGDGSSTINVNITPWRVPANGTLSNLTVFGFANAPSTLHCLIYKATTASTSPTYSATALDATVSSGSNIGEDTTHSVSVNKGDLIVGFCNTSWSVNGGVINVMYSPT